MSTSGTPIPIVATSSNGIKFNPPTIFDGSYKNYRPFMCDLEIFLAGYGVTDDAKKILIALSYMRGGHADEFVTESYENAVANAGDWGSYADFLLRLKTRFQSKNLIQESREKLERFTQDRMLIDEYFTKLDMTFADAQVTNDAEKIRIVERGVDNRILEVIYSDPIGVPVTYNNYKVKCLTIGRMKERYRNLQRIHSVSQTTSTHTASSKQAPPVFHTHIHPVPEKKTVSGVTYGGAGQPMELGQTRAAMLCFNCGKPGHLRRDCPEEQKKMNIRAMIGQFNDDEREEMRRELDSKEWDFANDQ